MSATVGILAGMADMAGKHDLAGSLRDTKAQIDSVINRTPDLVMSNMQLGGSFDLALSSTEAYTKALYGGEQAMDGYIGRQLDLWDSSIKAAEATKTLSDSLIAGRRNWDLSTEAGQKNQQALHDSIMAIEAYRDQQVQASDGSIAAIDAINAKYDEQLAQLLKIAGQAGATKAQLDQLNRTYYVQIIEDVLVRNQGNKASAVDQAMGISGARAGGGPIGPGNWLVGENQPEVVSVAAGMSGYVTPSASAWQSAGGGGQVVVQNQITLLDPMTGQRTRAILIGEATGRGVPSASAAGAYP